MRERGMRRLRDRSSPPAAVPRPGRFGGGEERWMGAGIGV
jgi:hypothetical protein